MSESSSIYLGNAALMRRAMSGDDLVDLSQGLLARATARPEDAHALMDLSMVLQLKGQRELALQVQAQALQEQTLYTLPATSLRPGQTPLQLLALMTPGDLMTNTPLDCLLENSDVALDMLYLGEGLPLPDALPDHDVLFFAIGASERHAGLLADMAQILEDWPRPVINLPQHTVWTARELIWQRLQDVAGLLVPMTLRVPRPVLQAHARARQPVSTWLEAGRFPILVRPVDTHAGQGLVRVDDFDALQAYLEHHEAEAFHVSNFIDYRSADGQYRKYRIALIGGRPYACHLAISSHWMIHYLNAGMDWPEAVEKRREEEAFMVNFDQDFGARYAEAFRAMHERMQLDYLVVDCTEFSDLTRPDAPPVLLVFEADTGAVVHALDPVDVFPYKPVQMQNTFQAFRQLLEDARRR